MERDWFDPAEYPHGIVCGACGCELNEGNAIRVDVTDEPDTPEWERTPEDEPRVQLIQCVTCTIEGRTEEDNTTGESK